MLRPTISNSPTGLRARRIFPTPPALLVGPSWLLRGDDVGDPRLDRSAIDHLDVGSLSDNRRNDAKKLIDRSPRPFIWRAHSRIEFWTFVRRSRYDDHGVIRSDNLSRVYFPALAGVSFMSPIGTAYTPCLRAAKETGATRTMFSIKSVHQSPCIRWLAAVTYRAAMAMGRCPGGFGRAPDRRYFLRYRDVVRFR
jgi:hypothetical protein